MNLNDINSWLILLLFLHCIYINYKYYFLKKSLKRSIEANFLTFEALKSFVGIYKSFIQDLFLYLEMIYSTNINKNSIVPDSDIPGPIDEIK